MNIPHWATSIASELKRWMPGFYESLSFDERYYQPIRWRIEHTCRFALHFSLGSLVAMPLMLGMAFLWVFLTSETNSTVLADKHLFVAVEFVLLMTVLRMTRYHSYRLYRMIFGELRMIFS